MEDPIIRNWMLLYLIRLGHKNLNFVFAGGYEGCFGLVGTRTSVLHMSKKLRHSKRNGRRKTTLLSTRVVTADGIDRRYGWWRWRRLGMLHLLLTRMIRNQRKAPYNSLMPRSKLMVLKRVGAPEWRRLQAVARGADGRATPKEEVQRIFSASPQPSAFNYQWKVKQAFDPNNLGDEYYQTLDSLKK